jgi:trans-aconitate methyltransferase
LPQTWDPKDYGQHGSFVHELAGGVVEWLAPRTGETILDLGCGDGALSKRLTDSGAHITGVDSSEEMVTAARAQGIHADHAAAEKLPYPDQVFDAVFSNAALHWIRKQDEMLTQVFRVLRPGGRFVAEFGGHGNIAAIRTAMAAVMLRHGHAELSDRGNYYPTAEEYKARLERNGFTVLRISLIPRPTLLGKGGMAAWLSTFSRGTLQSLPEHLRHTVVDETVALLAPILRDHAGNWTADYVRLRFAATR